MKYSVFFAMVLIYVVATACSNRELYTGIQQNREHECYKIPYPEEQESCLARLDMSYDEYERERQEVIDSKQ